MQVPSCLKTHSLLEMGDDERENEWEDGKISVEIAFKKRSKALPKHYLKQEKTTQLKTTCIL